MLGCTVLSACGAGARAAFGSSSASFPIVTSLLQGMYVQVEVSFHWSGTIARCPKHPVVVT